MDEMPVNPLLFQNLHEFGEIGVIKKRITQETAQGLDIQFSVDQ